MRATTVSRGRKIWLRIRRIWITAGIVATVVFVGWSLIAYRASGEAHAATQSDAAVAVRHENGTWSFLPASSPPASATSFVFFPGALVDPVAYAPLMRAVAAAGFPAYMVELPRRGAFGGGDDPAVVTRLDAVLKTIGPSRRWVVAGHSRGAVVACDVAARGRAGLAAVVLIGTSHPRDVDLSGLTVPVTKVVGTRDGLASREEVEQNRAKLPRTTRWVWVEGGNHSQFGWYGFQPLDRFATITPAAQREMMLRAVLDALKS